MADRLISADALKAALQGLYQVAGWEKRDIHFSLSDMECNIDYMPTIEAVPLEDYRSMEQTVYKLTQALAEAEPTKHYNTESYKMTVTDFPPVEYAPIKHGRWIWKDHYLVCSECGEENDRKNYCPNCGADMRGEQDG